MDGYSMVLLPWGGEITFYAFWLVLGALAAAAWTVYRAPDHGAGVGGAILFTLLSGALGLILGRAVYCGVRFVRLFYDPRGEFIGLAPFLDFSQGSVNVVGVILGVLLAAVIAGPITRNSILDLMDSGAIPGVALLAWARFVEPLSGMGFGDLVFDERLCRFPFAIENSMGDFSLSVCFIEAVLAALIVIALLIVDKRCRKNGTLAGIALTLMCVTQIMPESLRLDDVLFLFIFARVTQMGYAVILAGVLVCALIRGARRGLGGGTIALEIILLLLGAAVCVGAEFALDKTNLSKMLVYGVMIAALLGLGILVIRRLVKEDRVDA